MVNVLILAQSKEHGEAIGAHYLGSISMNEDVETKTAVITEERLALIERQGWSEGVLAQAITEAIAESGPFYGDVLSESVSGQQSGYCIWRSKVTAGDRRIALNVYAST